MDNRDYILISWPARDVESTIFPIIADLSHKFKIPVSGLNKKRIAEELTKVKVEVNTIASLLKVLNDCEMARFAPLSHSDAETTLTTTKTLINEIEEHVKK